MVKETLEEEHLTATLQIMTLSQDNQNKAPSVEFKQLLGSCPICLGDIESPSLLVPCCHVFCGDCLTESLKRSKECSTCRTRGSALSLTSPMEHQRHRSLLDDLAQEKGKRVILVVHGYSGTQRLRDIFRSSDFVKVHHLLGGSVSWKIQIREWEKPVSENLVHMLLVPLNVQHKEIAGVNLQKADMMIFLTSPTLGSEGLMQVVGRVIRPCEHAHNVDIVVYHEQTEALDTLKERVLSFYDHQEIPVA